MRIDRGLALLAALSITTSAAAQEAPAAAEDAPATPPAAAAEATPAAPALTPEQREKLKDELREELKAELLGELSATNAQGPAIDDSWAEEEFKWEEPVEPELNFVEFDGYFRFRYQYFFNLDLNTYYNNSVTQVVYGPFVTSQVSAPTAACNTDSSTGGCLRSEGRSGTLGTNNMRLRLEPVFNVYEDVKIKLQVDVFDNLVLGSTPEVFPGNAYTPLSVLSDTQLSPSAGLNSVSDSIKVKRVWTEIGTPLGQLRIGRMPSHFGMGLSFNDGRGIDADYGDNADRVAFATEIGDFMVIPAIEYSATGVTSASTDSVTGQAFDREQRDDANQWMLTILHTVDPEETKRRLSAGELVLNYGTVQAARFQSLDSAAFYSGDAVDDQASSSSLTKRDASLYRYSYWMKLMWEHLSIEAEYAGVLGKIGNPTTGSSATYSSDDAVNFSNGITLNQHGAAVNVEYRLLDDALTLGFLFVVASGDDSPGWGRMPLYGVSSGRASAGAWDGAQAGCTNIEVDNSGNQTCTGSRDRTLGNFQVDQAFVVDLIFWRQLVGGVTDAMVFRPSLMYRGDSGFGFRFDAVFSRALFSSSTPSGSFSAVDQDLGSGSNNLGLELDLKLFYDATQGLHTWLQYGMFIPFGGMDRLVVVDSSRADTFEGSTEVVSQTTYGRMDASLAHTLQLLVGVSFLCRSERCDRFVGRIFRTLVRTLQSGNA